MKYVKEQHNQAYVQFFGRQVKVNCDRRCDKAWGLGGWGHGRPTEQLSDDEDDFVSLSDDEVGIAPEDPGTYEGGHGKPLSPDDFPNKWCIRQCERCNMSGSGEADKPLEVIDWSKRHFNLNWREEAANENEMDGLSIIWEMNDEHGHCHTMIMTLKSGELKLYRNGTEIPIDHSVANVRVYDICLNEERIKAIGRHHPVRPSFGV